MDKEVIRQRLLKKRSEMPGPDVDFMSRKIVNALKELKQWEQADEVLLYWPIRNEVDVRPLLQSAWDSGKKLFMPCCRRNEPGVMDFGVVRAEKELLSGSFGIKEPCRIQCEFPDAVLPDIIVVPGVGFDRRGYRIGFGGGYYDRFLARPQKEGFLSVGVCYSFQLVEGFPVEPWDKAVQVVCTDKDMIWKS
ncbi:5-formyltetrahydrofolate cyclo-ligase [Maridesulfovibrio hydrothermalis]|uniref:5-formyltetrahydrofolate cyclo-ligase n=1 Tax=Maridesulfovibrio hydrothermalis AM13 = DSM 14728 TaxID=1121451 RepID=L0R8N7_9BACT|nr:5-formyltetrahydrofolate cyclo-ligase [Maridesulfovibrio hydrothermalis]CCO23124.1 5-formyltetrahydrofolate cyclo-ligase [Maridesulfovibrio hydrothermalis AM13 = DSM 14728]